MRTDPPPASDDPNDESPQHSTLRRAGLTRHIPVIAVLGVAALALAMFVTPADPLSMWLAFVPIFAFGLGAYWWGRMRQ